ncbi:MAG: serine hydrolase [Robiginitomaculum sp.]|nr:serine hydrolase [Robiginitomaculum sp.]
MRIFLLILLISLLPAQTFAAPAINSAISPSARSGVVSGPITVFAVMQNYGDMTANNCRIELDVGYSGNVPISLNYQTTSPANQLIGTINQPVDIAAGAIQNFLIELTGSSAITSRDIGFDFVCDTVAAPLYPGVNSMRITISDSPLPDLIPIAVTLSADGVMRIDTAGGASAFGTAVINIGAAGDVRVRADGGEYVWPVNLLVCETDAGGNCLNPASASLDVNFAVDQTRTFSVFGFASNRLGTPFMPELARAFLRLETLGGETLAATSVAIIAPDLVPDYTPLDITAARIWAAADGSRALIIQRDGVVLHEEYWGTGGVDVAERIFSGSKSFSCALAAAAMDDGILNPDDYAWSAISAWAPGGAMPQPTQKTMIRARDLISLTSGLRGRVTPAGFPTFSNTYGLAFSAPQDLSPGQQAIYGSTGFHSFTAFFELSTGGTNDAGIVTGGTDPAAYIQTNVLDPIGSQIALWNRDINGKPDFAAGASMTARNWIKYGQLLLDDGVWDSNQVLSRSSVRKCRHYYTPALGVYGLSFWLNRPAGNTWSAVEDDVPLPANFAGQMVPSSPDDHFAALGFGNMQLHMIPSEGLVIIKYGGIGDQNIFFRELFNGAFDD